jgi:hypothetical protein
VIAALRLLVRDGVKGGHEKGALGSSLTRLLYLRELTDLIQRGSRATKRTEEVACWPRLKVPQDRALSGVLRCTFADVAPQDLSRS